MDVALTNDVGTREGEDIGRAVAPSVSIVFLVYNRREQLRESLGRMLDGQYEPERLEVIVVDNASPDGAGDMVAEEFPDARLVRRTENAGVSGWNDGFAVATGDYVLALDDDCYLEPGGLQRAVAAASDADADLVSFLVRSSHDCAYRFNDTYRTGLLSFWGCAVLMRRRVVEALGGYDPEIFVWANELEFMVRFFDRGFRHLHLPEVTAIHMKKPGLGTAAYVRSCNYRVNARHFAYVAAKHMRWRDALEALMARLANHVREAAREHPAALRALPDCLAGFVHGLRHRTPVANPAVSRVYRRNFESYASPWWLMRPLREFLPIRVRAPARRRFDTYFAERARYYPASAETLEF